MSRLEVTIVIPSIKPLEECNLISSFLESNVVGIIYPQFVFMYNGKGIDPDCSTKTSVLDSHELIIVGNDRYFGSCEENIYRTQDFVNLFKERVFWIGEHDIVQWSTLHNALEFAQSNCVDMLGWNVVYSEEKEDGTTAYRLAISRAPETTKSGHYVNALLGGRVIEARIGYTAMLSLYGPTDWSAFIGSHSYSREACKRVMAYKASEAFYSHVFKQAQFAIDYPARYGFFNSPVIVRTSDAFMRARGGLRPVGAIDRIAQGGSPSLTVGCLIHLYDLEDERLFHLLLNSICLAIEPVDDGNLGYARNAMLHHIIGFALEALSYSLTAHSHYFPSVKSGSLRDILYVMLFFRRLSNGMKAVPWIYHPLDAKVPELFQEVSELLSAHLQAMGPGNDFLMAAGRCLLETRSLIKAEELSIMNQRSFSHFLNRGDRVGTTSTI